MADDDRIERLRSRREPPPLVPVTLVEHVEVTPRLLRLCFAGPEIDRALVEPAASIRLLVPSPGAAELVLPTWNGNEFLLADGSRPALRTFTPLAAGEPDHIVVEIVRHPGGVVSGWAERARVGAAAAISGPGRGAEFPDATDCFHLLGDETALPAISQLLEMLPAGVAVSVHAEVEGEAGVRPLPDRDGTTVEWLIRNPEGQPGEHLVTAASGLPPISPTTHVWAAGEAAAMQAIRKHLFDGRGVARTQATIRGYWKPRRD